VDAIFFEAALDTFIRLTSAPPIKANKIPDTDNKSDDYKSKNNKLNRHQD